MRSLCDAISAIQIVWLNSNQTRHRTGTWVFTWVIPVRVCRSHCDMRTDLGVPLSFNWHSQQFIWGSVNCRQETCDVGTALHLRFLCGLRLQKWWRVLLTFSLYLRRHSSPHSINGLPCPHKIHLAEPHQCELKENIPPSTA